MIYSQTSLKQPPKMVAAYEKWYNYYMNQTAGGFFQKEVQTLYISKENIIACNNFKANVMGSSSLTDFQINLPTG